MPALELNQKEEDGTNDTFDTGRPGGLNSRKVRRKFCRLTEKINDPLLFTNIQKIGLFLVNYFNINVADYMTGIAC